MSSNFRNLFFFWTFAFLPVILVGCDSTLSGEASGNRAPDTALSVRDASLVDNLGEADRLASTVLASWSGTDPDGYVTAFELRYYAEGGSADAATWTRTTRKDSLILLPIERGDATANVVLEVRSIDNDGLADDSPARTVFPIRNAPPTIAFSAFELPPDTTYEYISFGIVVDDPEGVANVQGIELSLNDSLNFVRLPADIDFVTLVGNVDRSNPSQTVADAAVFTGRAFQSTSFTIPGLLLDAHNTLYARAVDFTDTTSVRIELDWYTKKTRSDILFVNDFRSSAAGSRNVEQVHRSILSEFLPDGQEFDYWNIASPFGELPSPSVPNPIEPATRKWLAGYRYIYWFTTNSTNSARSNNLPVVASTMDDFLRNGGRLMVHSPIKAPADPADAAGNAAAAILPFQGFVSVPDSLNAELRIPRNAVVAAASGSPIASSITNLTSNAIILNTLPYETGVGTSTPLLTAEYQYSTRQGNRRGEWFGTSTVASISADGQVALFALPLINDFSGTQYFLGPDENPESSKDVIKAILSLLQFPQR